MSNDPLKRARLELKLAKEQLGTKNTVNSIMKVQLLESIVDCMIDGKYSGSIQAIDMLHSLQYPPHREVYEKVISRRYKP